MLLREQVEKNRARILAAFEEAVKGKVGKKMGPNSLKKYKAVSCGQEGDSPFSC